MKFSKEYHQTYTSSLLASFSLSTATIKAQSLRYLLLIEKKKRINIAIKKSVGLVVCVSTIWNKWCCVPEIFVLVFLKVDEE